VGTELGLRQDEGSQSERKTNLKKKGLAPKNKIK
jgi:hypothetical protein